MSRVAFWRFLGGIFSQRVDWHRCKCGAQRLKTRFLRAQRSKNSKSAALAHVYHYGAMSVPSARRVNRPAGLLVSYSR
jgi:hypothetical protein